MACELKLSVAAAHAGCLIGKQGATLRRIKETTGLQQLQLSQLSQSAPHRTVLLSGAPAAVKAAYDMAAELLRAEANARAPAASAGSSVRLLVPHGLAGRLIGHKGASLRQLRETSGAAIEVDEKQLGAPGDRGLVCTGSADQVGAAVHLIVDAIADRTRERLSTFLAHWPFETHFSDHFETPREAFRDILPVLEAIGRRCARRRARAAGTAASGGGGEVATAAALRDLVVYDPYYCDGSMRADLAALGCSPGRVLNEKRDFYADVASGGVPAHDVLVTNPPYSVEHKQRLLQYLRSARVPFLLLLPAWVVATDYWRAFLLSLAVRRDAEREAGGDAAVHDEDRTERRAGVFYVCPSAARRYAFVHPQATGHAEAPFHAVWCCGGFPTDKARRRAAAALKPARARATVELFRAAETMQKRGHFTPGAVSKRARSS